jgi:hypothetical protein
VPNIATAGFVWDKGLDIDVVCEPIIKSPILLQIGTVTTKKVKPNIGGGFNDDDVMYYQYFQVRGPYRAIHVLWQVFLALRPFVGP